MGIKRTMGRWLLTLALLLAGRQAVAAAAPAEAAQALYQQAVELQFAGQLPEADKLLESLRSRHPYSRFAALAELRLADGHRLGGKPQQAIEAYRAFIKFHPQHSQCDYARLQIAESYFETLPKDWGVLPPSAEKDQDAARRARVAYDEFLQHAGPQVAGSIPLATAHRGACSRRLADHELYVAQFYLRRQHYGAAAHRAELVLQHYRALGLDDEALWVAGQARAALGEAAQARLHLDQLLASHPHSPRVKAARTLRAALVDDASPAA